MNMKKRILALVMAVFMLLQAMPMAALADAVPEGFMAVAGLLSGDDSYCTVKFLDANGAEIPNSARLIKSGSTTEAPAIPTAPKDTVFAGWSDGTTPYPADQVSFTITKDTTFSPTYEKLVKYLIKVEFRYGSENGAVALPAYEEWVPAGTEYNKTIEPADTIAGFTADPAKVEIDQTVNENITKYIIFTGDPIDYTIKYRVQNLTNLEQYDVVETATGNAAAGTTIFAEDKTYTGFTRISAEIPSMVLGVDMTARDIESNANTLYVDYKRNSYRVDFDSDGGSNVAPLDRLYEANVTVDAPVKAGYTFKGWMDEEGKDFAGVSEGKSSFNMPARDLVLKAKWEVNETAPYTVVYWQEKIPTKESMWTTTNTDLANGYDFVESYTATGAVGAVPTYEKKTYDGFKQYKVVTPEIQPDGSTVVNVYYERNVYTIQFSGNRTDSIKAKYMTDISGEWAAMITDNGWSACEYRNGLPWYYSHVSEMPLGGFNAKVETSTDDGRRNSVIYYVETFKENEFEILISHNDSCFGRLSVEDKATILGFAFKDWGPNPSGDYCYVGDFYGKGKEDSGKLYFDNKSAGMSGNKDAAYLLYDRLSWEFSYENCSGVSAKSVKYEYPLSSLDVTTPKHPEGMDIDYKFDGWYTSPEYTTKYDFSGIMPAHNVRVFAKWNPPIRTVTFDSNGGSAVETQTVPKYETIEAFLKSDASIPAKKDDTFLGWYVDEALTQKWIPSRQVVDNTTLYARWENDDVFTYTVKYVDEKGEEILEAFNGSGKSNTSVTEEAPDIAGYYKKEETKNIFLDRNQIIIVFTYIEIQPWEYTVQYLDEETKKSVADPVLRSTSAQQVVENYLPIKGYELVGGPVKTLKIDAEERIITFYYKAPKAVYTVKHILTNNEGEDIELDKITGAPTSVGLVVTAEPKDYEDYTCTTTDEEDLKTVVTRDGEAVIIINYVIKAAQYKVEHYLQNLEKTGYDLEETETLGGKVPEKVSAEPKTFAGFTFNAEHEGNKLEGEVIPNINGAMLVLKLYYDRNSYDVSYEYVNAVPADAPEAPETQTYKFEEAVEVEDEPSLAGYVFSGWTTKDAEVKEGKFSMPAKNVLFVGSWEALPEKPVKAADKTSVEHEEEITYTISYFNHTNKPAKVILTDKLDEKLEYISGGSYDSASHTVTWTIKDVAAFARGSVELKAAVRSKVNDAFNTAVSVPNDVQCDINGEIRNSNEVIVEIKHPAISISKKANKTSGLEKGDTVEYTITVTNTGDVDLTAFEVADTMFAKMKKITYISAGTAFDAAKAVWTSAEGEGLPVGEARTLKYTYVITEKDAEAGRVNNVAAVKGYVDDRYPTLMDEASTVVKTYEPEKPAPMTKYTINYIYLNDHSLNTSEVISNVPVGTVVSDIGAKISAHTIKGYTHLRTEGLTLVAKADGSSVINVYYVKSAMVNLPELVEIFGLEVPTGANLSAMNVGDCCE